MMKRIVLAALSVSIGLQAAAQDLYTSFEIDASQTDRITANAGSSPGPLSSFAPCSESTVTGQLREMDRLVKAQRRLEAGAHGRVVASRAASCALALRAGKLTNSDLTLWAFLAGEGLATAVLTDFDSAPQSHARAEVYLTYAASRYERAADTLSQLKQLRPAAPTPSERPANAMTARKLVQELQGNSFGLWRTLTGKTLAVTGVVGRVTGEAKSAMISLDGRPPGMSDDQVGWQHFIECQITQSDQLDRAAAVRKGQSITVTGVVGRGLMGNVVLQSCTISR